MHYTTTQDQRKYTKLPSNSPSLYVRFEPSVITSRCTICTSVVIEILGSHRLGRQYNLMVLGRTSAHFMKTAQNLCTLFIFSRCRMFDLDGMVSSTPLDFSTLTSNLIQLPPHHSHRRLSPSSIHIVQLRRPAGRDECFLRVSSRCHSCRFGPVCPWPERLLPDTLPPPSP
jgi:hypothetical protein